MSEWFAFGRNEFGGCVCPAKQAGFNPEGGCHSPAGMNDAVEWYDENVRAMEPDSRGVVSEKKAKNAWLKALSKIEEMKYGSTDAAEEVAEELNWL